MLVRFIQKHLEWFVSGVLFLLVAVLFAVAIGRLNIERTSLAIDWRSIWTGLSGGLEYGNTGLRNAPWSVLPLLILGLLPMQVSWGLMIYLSLGVLIVSVPRVRDRRLYWLSVLFAVLSFPALRQYADGNVEALAIGGILLILYGYEARRPLPLAAGVLLATAKPQVVIVLLLVCGVYTLQRFSPALVLRTALIIVAVVLPTFFWRGPAWLDAVINIPERGAIVDMSLLSTLERLDWLPGAVNWLLWSSILVASLYAAWFGARTLSREKTGMLVAASLLLAPYSVGNSVLTLVAIAVIPLFQRRRAWGLFLLALVNLPLVIHSPAHQALLTSSNTAIVLIIWAVLLGEVWQAEIRPKSRVALPAQTHVLTR